MKIDRWPSGGIYRRRPRRYNNMVYMCITYSRPDLDGVVGAAVSATKIHSDGCAVVGRETELTVGRPSVTIARANMKLFQYPHSKHYSMPKRS